MKRFTKSFILAAVLVTTASCVEHQDLMPSSGEAIAISPLSGTATKAAIDGTTFPADRTMTVTAYYNAPAGLGTSANYFTATTFAKDGDVWAATPDPKYWPAGGTLDLFAWSADGLTIVSRTYPAKVADGVTVAVPDNATAQTDIIACGVRATAKVASGVPMAFRHAQALVCFTAGSEVPYNAGTNYGITINSITLKGAKYSGTLKMGATNELLQAIDGDATAEDGYFLWKDLASQADKALPTNTVASVKLPYNVPENPMDITAAGNHFGIGGIGILVPEQTQTRFVVEFTLHNGYDAENNPINNAQTFEYTCTGSWKEGIKYVYQMSFGFDEITVSPTMVDWNAQTPVEVEIPAPPMGA